VLFPSLGLFWDTGGIQLEGQSRRGGNDGLDKVDSHKTNTECHPPLLNLEI
jgi:hypothetical protein